VQVCPQDWQGMGLINPSQKDDLELPAGVRTVLNERYAEPNQEFSELLGAYFEVWDVSE
jgi:hypothetical protein